MRAFAWLAMLSTVCGRTGRPNRPLPLKQLALRSVAGTVMVAASFDAAVGTSALVRKPSEQIEPMPKPPRGWGGEVVLLFHGSGGPDKLTRAALARVRAQDARHSIKPRLYYAPDWSEFSQSVLTAAFNAQEVGEGCARAVRGLGPDVRSVHVIGVSVGAFAADACARATKRGARAGRRSPFVRLTLLDPFCARGVLDWGYGRRTFGTGVDYAEQILNTDDVVPSTNAPLPNCYCVDVTPAKAAFQLPSAYDGHEWPLEFWGRRFKLRAEAHSPLAFWRRWHTALPVHDGRHARGTVRTIASTQESV